MAILKIRTYPNDVLKRKAEPVHEINKDIERLIDDMAETMYNAPGIGLAAPQVGVSKRIIVLDTEYREGKSNLICIINPEIIQKEGEIDSEEGCLSLPGHILHIKRAKKVVVTGLDKYGNPLRIEGDGLLSRALQHEIDHLDGFLIFDRLGSFRRELFKRQILKESLSK